MTPLTRFRLTRIRKAGSAEINRMVDQEGYWTHEALKEILQRIEALNTQDPAEAKSACEAVYRLLPNIRNIPPDLRSFTLAVHGSIIRRLGEPEVALKKYREALNTPGISPPGRAEVLARMAVALISVNEAGQALSRVEEALPLVADPIPVLAVRGFIKMFTHPLDEALDDCIQVMERCRNRGDHNYSLFCAIINSCNILSYANCEADLTLCTRLKAEIEAYRKILPTGGSNYSKVRRPRLMLSRAEALLMIRDGQLEMAAHFLKRSSEGLKDNYPDEALDSYADLICLLGKMEREQEAAQCAAEAAKLLDRGSWRVDPIGRNALLSAAKRGSLSYDQAMELKIMLRLRKSV